MEEREGKETLIGLEFRVMRRSRRFGPPAGLAPALRYHRRSSPLAPKPHLAPSTPALVHSPPAALSSSSPSAFLSSQQDQHRLSRTSGRPARGRKGGDTSSAAGKGFYFWTAERAKEAAPGSRAEASRGARTMTRSGASVHTRSSVLVNTCRASNWCDSLVARSK